MGTKQFSNYDDLLTYTRASKGHALRPVSYGTELVTNGTFSTDSDWTKGTGWTISNGVADLDGSQGGNSDLSQSLTLKANAIYQLSVEVTAVTTALQYVTITNTGGAELDSLSTTGTYTAIFVAPSTSENLNIRGTSSSVSTIDNVSVKEVLFDQPDGTLTLFEHPENIPRVEYDADGNRLGLLVEEARTNILPYSEDFGNAAWQTNGSTKTASSVIAPNGTMTAYQLDYPSAGHAVYESFPVVIGQVYTFSVWIKADVAGTIRLARSTNGNAGENVNVTTEWQRFDVQLTPTVAGDGPQIRRNDSGQLSKIYVWGAQYEAGSFPTSYIKSNSGSTTTRSADVATIPVADFGYNTKVGSVVAEYFPVKVDATIRSVFELAKDNNDRLYSAAANLKHWFAKNNNVVSANIDLGASTEDQSNKIAGVYKLNDFAASLDGGSVTTDTSGLVQTGITDLHIGGVKNSASNYLCGHIKSIKYYPRRLSDAQLVELTS